MMPSKRCDGCDKALLLGAARFNVSIKITSGFDGYLPDDDCEGAEGRKRKMNALVENLADMSAEDLEKDVYQEINMMLCPSCRRRFLENVSEIAGESQGLRLRQINLLQ